MSAKTHNYMTYDGVKQFVLHTDYAALLARHNALREECDNLKDHNQYLEACLEDRNAEMMRHVRMYEALVEAVKKMRHANNKNRWNALEWAEACAEVDRLIGGE